MNDVTTTNRNQWVPPSRAGDAQAIHMIPNTSCTNFRMPGMDWKYLMLNLIQFKLFSGLACAWLAALGGTACDWVTVTTVSVIIVILHDYTAVQHTLETFSPTPKQQSVLVWHFLHRHSTHKTKRETLSLSLSYTLHLSAAHSHTYTATPTLWGSLQLVTD